MANQIEYLRYLSNSIVKSLFIYFLSTGYCVNLWSQNSVKIFPEDNDCPFNQDCEILFNVCPEEYSDSVIVKFDSEFVERDSYGKFYVQFSIKDKTQPVYYYLLKNNSADTILLEKKYFNSIKSYTPISKVANSISGDTIDIDLFKAQRGITCNIHGHIRTYDCIVQSYSYLVIRDGGVKYLNENVQGAELHKNLNNIQIGDLILMHNINVKCEDQNFYKTAPLLYFIN